MPRKKNSLLYGVALLLFLGGTGFLVYSGLSENSVYFLNVSEALNAPEEKLHNVRLFGVVAPDEMSMRGAGAGVDFLLTDQAGGGERIAVEYGGVVPDTFKAGAEVIVEGGMTADGRFAARTLMTKCPSKYQKENRG